MHPPESDSVKQKPASDPDLLLAALCYLMTRFTVRPCPGIAHAIIQHLESVLAHPKVADLPERSDVYRGLLQEWQSIIQHIMQQHAEPIAESAAESTSPRRGVLH